MLVKIDTYDICNGTLAGGVAIGNAQVGFDRVKDSVIPVDQIDPTIFDRTCHTLRFVFTVQRTFGGPTTAELFLLDLDANLPATGDVTLTPTNSVSLKLIPNGRMISHQSTLEGATSTTTYTIVGGQPVDAP